MPEVPPKKTATNGYIKAAEEIIAECRGICPNAQIRFLQTEDISLIQNVNRVCEEVIQMEEVLGAPFRG
jgi:hypothetical protein